MSRRYSQIKWTESQVSRLEQAVNAYNKAIEDKAAEWGRSGLAFLLPPTVDISTEIDKIATASQLNSRINALNRIHRKDAFDVDMESQLTKYELHEGQVAKSQINRYRIQRIKKMGGNVIRQADGSYKPADSFTYMLMNETNLMPTNVSIDRQSIHKLQSINAQYKSGNRDSLLTFWTTYVDQWQQFYSWSEYYSDVLNIVYVLMEAPLDVQNDVFYAYDEYGSFEYMYPLYDRSPLEEKAKNIYNYWKRIQSQYLKG